MAFNAKFIVFGLLVDRILALKGAQNGSAFRAIFLFMDIETVLEEEVVFVAPVLLEITLFISCIRRGLVSSAC
jgi:hypothetical protein